MLLTITRTPACARELSAVYLFLTNVRDLTKVGKVFGISRTERCDFRLSFGCYSDVCVLKCVFISSFGEAGNNVA